MINAAFDEIVDNPAPLAIVKKKVKSGPPSREELINERERNGYCKSISSESYHEDESQFVVARAAYISRAAIPRRQKEVRLGIRPAYYFWGWLEDRIYELRDKIADLPFPWGPKEKKFVPDIQWVQGKSGDHRDRLRPNLDTLQAG